MVAPDHIGQKRLSLCRRGMRLARAVPADIAGAQGLGRLALPGEFGLARKNEIHLFRRVLMPAGVRPRRITPIELTEGIVEMACSNLGVAVLARWAVAPALRARRIRGVRIERAGFRRHWFATLVRDPRRPAHLEGFVDQLQTAAVASA